MLRPLLAALLLGLLAACAVPPTSGPGGEDVYRLSDSDRTEVQFRMLDGVNALRQSAGAPPLQLNAELIAAAATHSRDMSVQNRPWHFGSDGSSPLDRAARVGYSGPLLGELISETYETELETLAAWMQDSTQRGVILDKRARNMGIAWYQESSGKIWWTMTVGG